MTKSPSNMEPPTAFDSRWHPQLEIAPLVVSVSRQSSRRFHRGAGSWTEATYSAPGGCAKPATRPKAARMRTCRASRSGTWGEYR